MIPRRTVLGDPPLEPSPGEGRSLLRDELDRSEYRSSDWWERLQQWLSGNAPDGPSGDPSRFQQSVAIVLGVLLLIIVVWLLSRVHLRWRKRAAEVPGALFGESVGTAAQLRGRAEAALAAGEVETAVVEGYRALALRQIEADLIDEVPGATAVEVARMIGDAVPAQTAALVAGARGFDAVFYGHQRTTAEFARSVLALDEALPGTVRRSLA